MSKKIVVTPEQIEEVAAVTAPSLIPEKLGVSRGWVDNLKQRNPELHAALRRGRDRYNGVSQAQQEPAPVEANAPSGPTRECVMSAMDNVEAATVRAIQEHCGGELRDVYRVLGEMVADGLIVKVNEVYKRPGDVWEDPEEETFASMKERIRVSLTEVQYQSVGQIFGRTKIPYGIVTTLLGELIEAGEVEMQEVAEFAVYYLVDNRPELPLYNTGANEFAQRVGEPEPAPAEKPDSAGSIPAINGVIPGWDACMSAWVDRVKGMAVKREEDASENMLPETDPAEDVTAIPGRNSDVPGVARWMSEYVDRVKSLTAKRAEDRGESEQLSLLDISPSTVEARSLAQHFSYNVGCAIEHLWEGPTVDSIGIAIDYLTSEIERLEKGS
ncbi:MAG TPA: hypothetical protein PLX39_15390 [Pyrinomonadaceae bacterium]|nr:hypothetical protein [Pyrinomonadaceae bacterium]